MGRFSYIIACSIVLSVLLVGIASASIPDNPNTTLLSNKEWIVANGADTAIISLTAVNASNRTANLPVIFSINDTTMADIIAAPRITGTDGVASTQITSKKKSGTVLVYATVYYRVNDTDLSEPVKNITYTYPQKIDHDTPYNISYDSFPDGIVTVGTEIPIVIQMRDEWGNLVENKNPAVTETINLSVQGSPHDLAAIKNGSEWAKGLDVLVDSLGYFSTTIKVSTYPGFHSFLVKPVDMPVSEKPYYVRSVANGIPANVTSRFEIAVGGIGDASVAAPEATADGYTKFFVIYTLYDQYGNPVSDKVLNFFSNRSGEGRVLPASTDLGEVKIYYGPSDEVGLVNLTVTAVENASVSLTDTVSFISGRPADLSNLTAYPEVMPSVDAYAGSTSEIRARVTTAGGTGSPGEIVTFSLVNEGYADRDNYNITSYPHLGSTSVITDSNGYATVVFTPGGFGVYGDPKYVASATGWVTVVATWNSIPHSVLLTWKNYPYLSAETSVSPQVVNVSDNVTVTLRLKGDGYLLQPIPADIVIVTDLAGGIGGTSRLADTKKAEKDFVANMSNTTRIALVSFGQSPTPTGNWDPNPNNRKPYQPPFASQEAINMWNDQITNGTKPFVPYIGAANDTCLINPANWDSVAWTNPAPYTYSYLNPYSDATIDLNFTNYQHKNDLNTTIDGYKDWGGTNYAAGLNAAIDVINAHGIPGHTKSIIIMGDGINMMAPIAPGSYKSYWPSDWHPRSELGYFDESDVGKIAAIKAADRAKSLGITIYGAGFPTPDNIGLVCGCGHDLWIDTDLLTNMTSDGCYYPGTGTADLSARLQAIEGRIQKEEYVNTTTDLDYGMVHVTQENVDTTMPGVFSYVYKNPVSTMNRTYWRTNPSANVNNSPTNYYDQTADWADNNLSFNVGTLKLNQVWMTTYMLQVNKVGPVIDKPGVVDAFGVGSIVSFNNNTSFLAIPKTPITVLPNLSEEKATKKLVIDNLTATTNGSVADLWVDIKILPNSPNLSVTADIYITDTDQHTTTWIKSVELGPIVNGNMKITSVDLSQFPKGKKYTFYVDFINKQPGTNPIYWASLTSNGFVILAKPTGVYIKLE